MTNKNPLLEKPLLAQKVHQLCYLRGNFKLRSGQTSTEYFDKYRFESNPQVLLAVAHLLVPLIPKSSDALGGLEMGGIPVATALSLASGIPTVFVRKKAKDYGTCLFAEGMDIQGKEICVIEDVITTGGQVLQSVADLRGAGAIVKDVLCVILRGENVESKFSEAGLKITALFSAAELKQAAIETSR